MATNLLIALRADSADFSEHPLMQKANRSVLQTAACPLCRVTMLEWGGARSLKEGLILQIFQKAR
jgi:hypothetical protein